MMEQRRDFKGIWIPKNIWLSKLKIAYRVFLAEIDSLDNGDGCFASNDHFAELFDLSKNRCSEIIQMLEKEGFIAINNSKVIKGEIKRVIVVNHPFSKAEKASREIDRTVEKSTGAVEMSTGAVEMSTGNNKVLLIHRVIQERERRAIDFLKENYPSRFTESFLMKFGKQIEDLEKFIADFNDTVEIEKLDYDARLFNRLSKYARNWVANKARFQPKKEEEQKQNNPNRVAAI